MEVRRRQTLADRLAVIDSLNLGDLLKEHDEDEIRRKRNARSKTLLAIINEEQQQQQQQQQEPHAIDACNNRNRIKWRYFRARLKPRRSATHSDESPVDPITTIPAIQNTISTPIQRDPSEVTETDSIHRNMNLADALAAEREWRSATTAVTENGGNGGVPAVMVEMPVVMEEIPVERTVPVRVSLSALLEQADPAAAAEVAAPLGEEEERGDERVACCVCLVRQKGAAFIPCGHTFCRRCSREVWLNRGSCPLCNAYILEILDIF